MGKFNEAKYDPGLRSALKAVNGPGNLAKLLGVPPSLITNWHKVPPNRVIAVEAASGVRRQKLRPDLYPEAIEAGEGCDPPLQRAIELAGGVIELARLLGIVPAAMRHWRRTPPCLVLEVERHTGVSRHELRPDKYPISSETASAQ